MFREETSNETMLIALLAGGIVGAGLALLLAPQSGKKTRGKIADMAEGARDYASDYAKKVKEKIS